MRSGQAAGATVQTAGSSCSRRRTKPQYNFYMRRLVLVTVFAVLAAAPVFGQMRGGVHLGGGIGRAGFVGHGSSGAVRGHSFAPSVRGGVRYGSGFRSSDGTRFHNGRFHHHHHHFFFGAGFYYPGYYWPYYSYYAYPYYDYSYPLASYSAPSYEYTTASSYELEMTRELDRLTAEVERLREQQDKQSYGNSAPSIPNPDTSQQPRKPTVLVFRDKHIQEVQNYAIVGETLWLFNEQRATKIPLSELDLPATAKLNEERGIEFRAPAR